MPKDTADNSRYAARGVSSGKGEVHSATAGLNKGLFPGAFCQIFAGDEGTLPGYGEIIHNDGSGSKALLAYLAHKTGFGSRVWQGIAQDSLVMNLDDVSCVGALGSMLVSQTIARNKYLISGEDLHDLVEGCKEFCDRMNNLGLGFHLRYGSGETEDLADQTRTITVGNTVCAKIKLEDVVDASRMKPGDIIIGFSSIGQAFWEDEPNSGIGSNGLTNARHDVLAGCYKFHESFAPEMQSELIYHGKYRLEDRLPGDDRFTIGSALLSPTRTYAPLIRKLVDLVPRGDIHGLIHCSGGGQTKIGKFGAPGNRYVKNNLFPVSPLFAMLQSVENLPWQEMYSSYNMGHRLEVVVPESAQDACFKAAKWAGIEARCVGHVEQSSSAKNEVVIESSHGTFIY